MTKQLLNSNQNFDSKPKKLLSPKLDVVFQALFGEVGSERITARFLESILQQEISEIDLSQNTILRRENENDKLGVLDIITKINKTENCNIEMQLTNRDGLVERILYYWSKVYSKQIKKGIEYEELEKTIVILIADFNIKELEGLKYHTEWKIIDTETRKVILTNKLEIHIIELMKAKEIEEDNELLDWLNFLEDPKSERVKEKMKENEELKEAVEKLNGMSEDEYMQRIADLREKAILDERAGLSFAKKEGEEKAKKEIAKNLLGKGISLEIIIETTGLTKEEIERL